MKPLSIYLHVPFCARKCAYCDFASYAGREGEWRRYFDALGTEIRLWSEKKDFGLLSKRYQIQSLYVGGGTPTLPDGGYIEKIISDCRQIAPFTPDAEITVEGNPGTLTMDRLEGYRRAGVNRLSLGAQSFDDGLLKSLGRIHTAEQIKEAVAMARAAGFENINLDLMYGLPGQTMAQWVETLERAIALDVAHISAYSLIVESGTPMARRVACGEAALPDDDLTLEMQRTATDVLAKADCGRYEISNYAKPGFECRHNRVYWNRGDYLGLGCAAHSLLEGCRFSNPAGLEAYLSGERRVDFQRLTAEDAMEETIMLSTRTVRGLALQRWRDEFGTDFMEGRSKIVKRLVDAGLIEVSGGFLRCTPRGMEVQNAVVVELI